MTNYVNEPLSDGNGTIMFESRTRVVLIGNTQTGKTSIIQRFFRDQFVMTEPTICSTTFTRVITESNHKVVINYCDTAGQEKYRSLGQLYYRDAVAAILVFDITDRKSFDDVEEWVQEYRNLAPSPFVYLVGNKYDLKETAQVSDDEIEEKSKALDVEWIYTSAVDGTGIQELFHEINGEILNLMREKWKTETFSTYQPKELDTTTKNQRCGC